MSRLLCPRCERPPVACLCSFLSQVDNEAEVLILQHPSESREAKGTARLLQLSLARCTVRCGEHVEPPPADGRQAWLLYPGGDASAQPAAPTANAIRLIVLDGSWRKSRKLLHLNPWLLALPRYSLGVDAVGVYGSLRRAHAPGQLSTLEATALALAQIEGNAARYAGLLAGLQGFVEQSLRLRDDGQAAGAGALLHEN